MLKSHERFHSANGKRLVLVADDEFVNREILKLTLQDDYELIFAEDGKQTLAAMREHCDDLSLVLLDIMMPEMSGTDVLKQARIEPEIAQIPIIVLTSDQDAEVESLDLGAIDFIPKPYPKEGVVKARIRRTIELSEDRQIITSTERDPLTGLYNREYFYRYAEQYDHHHKNVEMDAIVVDVNHFHMLNDRFGTDYGDRVLRRIGEALRTTVIDIGGIVCRREADTFLVYCPHGKDYQAILESASMGLSGESGDDEGGRIWLRMGVYANADKDLEIERRFDRAKMAADTVQGSFTKRVGVYDSALRERELYTEQLISDFDTAIREHQFQVYYQPKFAIQPAEPLLKSAEALVRWNHPKLGMISPGVFIPLFEHNGLIQQLDMYIWRETADQMRKWKERYDYVAPVSVNVSRIDMYDPFLVDDLVAILNENGLTTDDLLLEITESAYTQDSEQIIETVNQLRGLGFQVEMDDFGTGYSSLNMISTLPIDALKLDMMFITNAFGERSDTRMIEIIIDIARYLGVPVIAEGVETERQMIALRAMGCDYVQGYYFSKPLPVDEYESYVATRSEQAASGEELLPAESGSFYVSDTAQAQERLYELQHDSVTYAGVVEALATDYFGIYYVNVVTGSFIECGFNEVYDKLELQKGGNDFFEVSYAGAARVMHPDDVDMFCTTFTREAILADLEKGNPFTLTYRLMFDGVPTYVHMKATRMGDEDHIVIGVSNIDEQIRREQEHAQALRMAGRDALTGVKSKHAYSEDEEKINRAIEFGDQAPFAVAVCDVNDLKEINDTQGHIAGDQRIKDACAIVCKVFEHSPVYRIGGDEFVAILRGSDYEDRERLMEQLETNNASSASSAGVMVAGGMSAFQPGVDADLASVFHRADVAMYENKKALKTL